MKKLLNGIVVPHTHWDRAWYLPFQAYRLRLVEMMNDLLAWLESGALPLFVLDGQTVLLEDYFAVRPRDESRVRALVKAGKIRIGPWYTMPDCFLARPESLIRNLQLGLEMASDWGGASKVGYVPDSFGHFAQLPQILRGFGIDSFLFMRGMPVETRDTAGAVFRWCSPDGSAVLATYLREGYFPLGALGQESFHGRYDGLTADPERARTRLNDTLNRLKPFHTAPVVVLPAGGDHLPARADLVAVLETLNQQQNDIHLQMGGFEEYLDALRESLTEADVPAYSGDLLGQADHPLLRNVLSSRVDLKISNHKAQSILTRVVEPLLAWSRAQGLPVVDEALVSLAWSALLRNHAHDDICGCSVDDVHLDDVQRFAEVIALCEEIITRQIEHICQRKLSDLDSPRQERVFAFNPHPWPVSISRRVRLVFADDGGEFSEPSAQHALKAVNAEGKTVSVRTLSSQCKAIRNRYLETTWGRAYEVLIETTLPALGFDIITVSESDESPSVPPRVVQQRAPKKLLDSFRFEWDVDLGDGYSFGPYPELGTEVARFVGMQADEQHADVFHLSYEVTGYTSVLRDELNTRALKECLGARAKMDIHVVARRTVVGSDSQAQTGTTGSSGEQWELNISYTNIFRDSRLRLVFDPSVIAGAQGLGECHEILADGQAHRVSVAAQPVVSDLWPGPLATPAYPGEKPYPVHHTNDGVLVPGTRQTFFCGGVGLHEFEVVSPAEVNRVDSDAAAAPRHPHIALTLHRAVGYLSVRGGRIRSCQAGPQRATPEAQLLKKIEHTAVFGITSNSQSAWRSLKELLHPCWLQECPRVPLLELPGNAVRSRPAALSASMFDLGDTPLEIMCFKPASTRASSKSAEATQHNSTVSNHSLSGDVRSCVLRIVNPSSESVHMSLDLSGLTTNHVRAVRTMLDERTEVDGNDWTHGSVPSARKELQSKTLHLNSVFKPYEIQTWKIDLC